MIRISEWDCTSIIIQLYYRITHNFVLYKRIQYKINSTWWQYNHYNHVFSMVETLSCSSRNSTELQNKQKQIHTSPLHIWHILAQNWLISYLMLLQHSFNSSVYSSSQNSLAENLILVKPQKGHHQLANREKNYINFFQCHNLKHFKFEIMHNLKMNKFYLIVWTNCSISFLNISAPSSGLWLSATCVICITSVSLWSILVGLLSLSAFTCSLVGLEILMPAIPMIYKKGMYFTEINTYCW